MTQIVTFIVVAVAVAAATHAVMYKRDSRAAIAWVAFIIIVPLAGALAYWLLGVNRIRRLATSLRPNRPGGVHPAGPPLGLPEHMRALATLTARVSPFPLCPGNRVRALPDGDDAFPEMIAAIESATDTVAVSTYIFGDDPLGRRVADALAAAHRRGVQVRVLVDALGQRYARTSMVRRLRHAGVPAAVFLPVTLGRQLAAFNLRNHRKLLAIDGARAFIGGLNLRGGPVDTQYEVSGPVVTQLLHVFADDWSFTTGEALEERWFPEIAPDGETFARALPDGPDDHFEALKLVMLGALAGARRSVCIVTPYFLPDQALIHALNVAAMRGVEIDILLPKRGNLLAVQWAAHASYWQVLQRGCRIWHSPPPFDHSKLMLVDDEWALVGSTNWDPRSLRLNFELNLECYDAALGRDLRTWFDRRLAAAAPVTKEEMDSLPFLVRLRNGAARLLTPYL